MSLPQVGDLVRLLHPTSDKPYEDLLGIVLGYETKGAMRSKVRVVWTTGDLDNVFCYSPIRLKVVNESR
mgnify:FL=1